MIQDASSRERERDAARYIPKVLQQAGGGGRLSEMGFVCEVRVLLLENME